MSQQLECILLLQMEFSSQFPWGLGQGSSQLIGTLTTWNHGIQLLNFQGTYTHVRIPPPGPHIYIYTILKINDENKSKNVVKEPGGG